ncbi:MAG: hypothetical protein KatS3mg082_3051 [Nitrospiraceae bacterium]|nr:MAG: hypothetical protein KatS3mg082_3051 [Nitrospiraceae bacterium]
MKLNFDLENVKVTEFGVGRDDDGEHVFVQVPVDRDVQSALREMMQATWEALQRDEDGPARYNPSEKHGSTAYLFLPLNHDMAASLRQLHQVTNLTIDTAALSNPNNVFCYFARFTDEVGRRLTAVRRAAQFKGILKSKGRLVRILDDTLAILQDTVFKLDSDFDLLIDSANVHILRPHGFEFVGKLQEAILGEVPANIALLRKGLPFVEFDRIEEYAKTHPRAARYLASIRAQQGTKNIDKAALKRLCKRTGVDITESKGKLVVAEGHEMGFLEVLDRRRYEVDLVRDQPERYRAGNRRRIEG